MSPDAVVIITTSASPLPIELGALCFLIINDSTIKKGRVDFQFDSQFSYVPAADRVSCPDPFPSSQMKQKSGQLVIQDYNIYTDVWLLE